MNDTAPNVKEERQTPARPIEDSLLALRAEVDSLQQHVLKSSRRWYQETSTLISALALAFTFVTAGTAYLRESKVELIATRQELREILQRLAIISRENFENTVKWKNEPIVMMGIAGFINQENSFLVRQAHEIISSLPKNIVTSSEYHAVAQSLFNAYQNKAAAELLEQSLAYSDDFNTEVSALRMLGNINFIQGKAEAGRKRYQAGLDIFSKYDGYDQATKLLTLIQTELLMEWTGCSP